MHIGDNPSIAAGAARRTTRSLFLIAPAGRRLHRARRGRAVRHRRRGALRRHGPLRQAADPPRLVRRRHAGAGAQLLRPGRDAARRIPRRSRNPFFEMAPDWALYPLIALATCATVIASQALITAAFSVTKQAIQLGYLPRLRIAAHLGARDRPDLRAVRQLEPVLRHRRRRRRCSARATHAGRGLRHRGDDRHADHDDDDLLRDPLRLEVPAGRCAVAATGFFFVVDFTFFAANVVKVFDGGWFPLLIGAVMFTLMMTWKQGRKLMAERLRDDADRPDELPRVGVRQPADARARHGGVPGRATRASRRTRCCTTSSTTRCCTSATCSSPSSTTRCRGSASTAPLRDRGARQRLLAGDAATSASRTSPTCPTALAAAARAAAASSTTWTPRYFLSRDIVIPTLGGGMADWREKLFASMHRNAVGGGRLPAPADQPRRRARLQGRDLIAPPASSALTVTRSRRRRLAVGGDRRLRRRAGRLHQLGRDRLPGRAVARRDAGADSSWMWALGLGHGPGARCCRRCGCGSR